MASSWDESLETGNAIIDSQHRQLISLVDTLRDTSQPADKVLRVLNELKDFAIIHFASEEELVAEVNYPPDATQTMIYQHQELAAYMRLRILEFRRDETFNIIPFQSLTEHQLKVHEFELDRQLVDWIRQQDETSRAA